MDNYAKLRLLGEGAFGRVFLAREKRTQQRRLVCIKQLHAGVSVFSSQNEVALMQRVRHPNVVRLLDAFVATSKTRCIVMELCSGGDLRAFLKQQKPAPQIHEDRVWYWAMQLCLALAYLHEPRSGGCVSIWHRDVKTSNIFLSNAGFLVLGDLGVAREASVDLASTVVGTPLYIAPEIWDGRPYDGACDLWALGCTLYEICMGKTPFEDAKTTPALIKRVCDGAKKSRYTPLPSQKWSQRLRTLIDELLSVDPAKRPTAATILKQKENAIHLSRYLQDRRTAVAKLTTNGMKEQEQEEQAILLNQLKALGVDVQTSQEPLVQAARPAAKPQPSSASVIGVQIAQQVEIEQRLRLQREQERYEQLRVALQRMQELRLQQQQQQVPIQPRPVDAETNRGDRKAGRVVVAASSSEECEWKVPVQAEPPPPSSSRPSSSSPSRRRSAPFAFAGIPRQGVTVTAQAKAFASKTQSPLCRDVRVLRKQEFAKSAERYKATLDKRFNASNAKEPSRQPASRKQSAEGDDKDIAEGIAQLEAALRAQLV